MQSSPYMYTSDRDAPTVMLSPEPTTVTVKHRGRDQDLLPNPGYLSKSHSRVQ